MTRPYTPSKIDRMTKTPRPSIPLDIARPVVYAHDSRTWARTTRSGQAYKQARRSAADWLRMARRRCASSDERRALLALWRIL